MNISSILDELRQERVQLEEAILSLERLALGGKRRRGRPPAWMALAKSMVPTSGTAGSTYWQQEQDCRSHSVS